MLLILLTLIPNSTPLQTHVLRATSMPDESVIAIKGLSLIPDGRFVTPANLSRQKLPISTLVISPQDFALLPALPPRP
jgi:hypothetical protein